MSKMRTGNILNGSSQGQELEEIYREIYPRLTQHRAGAESAVRTLNDD